MRLSGTEQKITVDPQFCISLALALLIIPVKWIAAWMIASALHELCHYLAIRLNRCRVFQIRISFNGAVMETDFLNWAQEAMCALAGPIGGFALLLVARWFPRVAICGCFQSLYNLLPIFPLDGGRLLRCVLNRYMSEANAQTVCAYVGNVVCLLLCVFGIYALVKLSLGPIPLLFAIILFMRSNKIKIPCKEARLRVQ